MSLIFLVYEKDGIIQLIFQIFGSVFHIKSTEIAWKHVMSMCFLCERFKRWIMRLMAAILVRPQCTQVVHYMANNHQPVAMLLRRGLNNVVLPTWFMDVDNIVQNCHTRFRLNNIVQCMLLTTMINVGSTTLFSPVILQDHNLLRSRDQRLVSPRMKSTIHWVVIFSNRVKSVLNGQFASWTNFQSRPEERNPLGSNFF